MKYNGIIQTKYNENNKNYLLIYLFMEINI